MRDSPAGIPLALRRGIKNPDALKRLEEALLAPPAPEPVNGNGQQHQPPGLKYEFHRPWYQRLIAVGCARCGGQPQGWIQRQIQTPYRFKRFVLWTVNLLPRGTSFILTAFSGRVSSARYAERQASCGTCPAAVIQLRVVRGTVRENQFCDACSCGKWYLSRNAVRNWRKGWRCPLSRHVGSNPNAAFNEYIGTKQVETRMAHLADAGGTSNGGD